MPLYEYQCDACGFRFELIQKFSDPPAETCPTCGGPVRKLMSSPAIQFKGSGWYITDYAKKDRSAAKSDGSSADSAEAKDKGEKTEKSDQSAAGASTATSTSASSSATSSASSKDSS
jgi:putative FmdB family regulatory protein